MKHLLPKDLLEATRRTRAGRVSEATAALQRMLRNRIAPGKPEAPAVGVHETIEGRAQIRGKAGRRAAAQDWPEPEALRDFLDRIRTGRSPFTGDGAGPSPLHVSAVVPDGAQFLSATITSHAGSRPYKHYVPSGYRAGQAVSLIVMLHGCAQSPDDFAVGTRMNDAAEAYTFLVAYPEQTSTANSRKCWNWFNAGDQRRDIGEPSLIAGITRSIMHDYAIDPRRVYVAGLSAGGAAAAIMGDAYPDLFAAIGVHSGLACGAARDLRSAFAVMKHGGGGFSHSGTPARIVPTIVFHGDRDATVNLRNGEAVVAQVTQQATLITQNEEGRVPGGHAYRRSLHVNADGQTVVEQWVVHGGGHAWFGGSPAGSYTDPRGPDATNEMLRFFREHPRSMMDVDYG